MERNLLRLDYNKLVGGDLVTLHDALHQLIVYGLLLVTNAPTEFGAVEKLMERLGHVRTTHYGWVKGGSFRGGKLNGGRMAT